MSDRTLVYSPLARKDLARIRDYISNDLQNPLAAINTIEAILGAVEELEQFPHVGRPVERVPFVGDEYRCLPVRNYLVFYRVSDTSVFVDRILYKRRDYMRLLGLND